MSNRLEALRIYCVAAETRNFREAAARLAVSPQVVTRVVKELEDELGEPLFHRSTRGVQLTTFGEQLVPRAREAVGGVDGLFHRSDRRTASAHAGVVRIAAPTFIGRQFVLGHLSALSAQHPGLVLDMRLSEAIADVVDQQIDVGVRIGFMRDSRFVARPVGKADFVVVGAPALLERVGQPSSLEELFALPTTALVDRNTGRLWPWLFKGGRQMSPSAPTFVTDHAEAECEAVLAGIGFGQLTAFFAEPYIRAGRLVRLFDEQAPDPWTLFVYRSQRAPVPARVRLVFDSLIEALTGLGESTA
ncbi:LysR family transcriptional regulator [Variovorax sp. HJSM1_2]|uniref:LysR family transcriptional regulator n=1 Tax=Variovorax sp. HJSM1_2 TaxID=3366263 RepID=UPI003BE01102